MKKYSFIIPVYNRPDEIDELLESISKQTYLLDFEVVIVEDGSSLPSEEICKKYANSLTINYLRKENTGPGDSRNFGMKKANGDFFIILDSDCVLPEFYLETIDDFLQKNDIDCIGGSDAATDDFTPIQKAINYAMTSFFTTGGIRGSKHSVGKFQPRSFNMGLSKKVFLASGGFGNIHPGEDPDLVFRLLKLGFKTAFVEGAFVYHKRRISWEKFKIQISKFGKTRAILNHWHPTTKKLTYWLPFCFVLFFVSSVIGLFFGYFQGMLLIANYLIIILLDSSRMYKSLKIGLLSVWAVLLQFFSYGIGFFYASCKLFFSKEKPEKLFPNLFFLSN